MSAVAASWTDLLDGEEVAYSGVEPARDPKLEPLPDDLDPSVASVLVATGGLAVGMIFSDRKLQPSRTNALSTIAKIIFLLSFTSLVILAVVKKSQGTGSGPWPPHGLQRKMRFSASQLPRAAP